MASSDTVQLGAAWNAGLVGYFAERPVVNIDGLVNDRILLHAKAGTLPRYIVERGITHILDFEAMFNAQAARRGGYDPQLKRCVTQVANISSGQPLLQMNSSDYMIYALDRACVGRL